MKLAVFEYKLSGGNWVDVWMSEKVGLKLELVFSQSSALLSLVKKVSQQGDSTTLGFASQGDSEADSTFCQIAVCLEEGWWVPPDCWMWFTWWLEGWWWCKLWLLWSPAEHFGFVVECVILSKNTGVPHFLN